MFNNHHTAITLSQDGLTASSDCLMDNATVVAADVITEGDHYQEFIFQDGIFENGGTIVVGVVSPAFDVSLPYSMSQWQVLRKRAWGAVVTAPIPSDPDEPACLPSADNRIGVRLIRIGDEWCVWFRNERGWLTGDPENQEGPTYTFASDEVSFAASLNANDGHASSVSLVPAEENAWGERGEAPGADPIQTIELQPGQWLHQDGSYVWITQV